MWIRLVYYTAYIFPHSFWGTLNRYASTLYQQHVTQGANSFPGTCSSLLSHRPDNFASVTQQKEDVISHPVNDYDSSTLALQCSCNFQKIMKWLDLQQIRMSTCNSADPRYHVVYIGFLTYIKANWKAQWYPWDYAPLRVKVFTYPSECLSRWCLISTTWTTHGGRRWRCWIGASERAPHWFDLGDWHVSITTPLIK